MTYHWRSLLASRPIVLRLLVVLVFLWATEQLPQPIVLVPPQQTVITQHPIVGVHARLTDEVEPWKIRKTFEMVREMGSPWVVEFFPWAYYEPGQRDFQFGHADLVVDHARAQGLNVIARIGYVPWWARPHPKEQDTSLNYLDQDNYDELGDFVFEFVRHFKGRVHAIVIWNEPNLTFEWGFRPVDPAGYAELLRVVYPRAKQADPDIVVLGGALAPTLEPDGSPNGMNDLAYLQKMYDAGAAPYFDALAVHAYGLQSPADEPPSPDRLNFRRVELAREVMVRNGDAAKPVYVTEAGWNDSPRWNQAVRPAQRIDDTLAAYQWAEEHWPWCKMVAMWAFRYPTPAHSYQDNFTFVGTDFEPRPIYLKVQEWATR
jgi:polysaccharide biosynthesis protein PslG